MSSARAGLVSLAATVVMEAGSVAMGTALAATCGSGEELPDLLSFSRSFPPSSPATINAAADETMPSSPLTQQFPSMKGTTDQSTRFLGTVCHYDNTMTDKSLWQNNEKKVIFPCTVHAVDAVLQPQSLRVYSLTSEAMKLFSNLRGYSRVRQ